MRLGIMGSSTFFNYKYFKETIDSIIKDYDLSVNKIISFGGLRGVGRLAEMYAKEKNIQLEEFQPDYAQNNKKQAETKSNDLIIDNSDMIALWNSNQKKTKDIVERAKESDKDLIIIKV